MKKNRDNTTTIVGIIVSITLIVIATYVIHENIVISGSVALCSLGILFITMAPITENILGKGFLKKLLLFVFGIGMTILAMEGISLEVSLALEKPYEQARELFIVFSNGAGIAKPIVWILASIILFIAIDFLLYSSNRRRERKFKR